MTPDHFKRLSAAEQVEAWPKLTPFQQSMIRSSQQLSAQVKEQSPRSTLIYVVLAIFLGGLGVHNLYIGRMKRGLWQLLIGLGSAGTLVLLIGVVGVVALLIWITIDIVTIRTDGDGRALR